MLTHPTLDKLQTLKLTGMYHALVEQIQMADIADAQLRGTLRAPGRSRDSRSGTTAG